MNAETRSKSKLATIVIAALSLAACSDASDARRVLDDQGYTDIRVGGHAWFACSDHDSYATKFTAKSPIGRQVSGAVCKGIFKNSTIRLD